MQNESPKTFVFMSEPLPILLRNATSNGGDASRVGFFSSIVSRRKNMQLLFNRVCMPFLSLPDAGRVAPIRGSVLW
jgi:hypothetical protein